MSLKIQEDARREVDQLREENYKLEASVDDYKQKLQFLEKQISEAHAKLASFSAAEEEIVRLKDEIDSLSESAAKVAQYEQTINTYKKRLEEMADLKATIKQLEDKNVELDKRNFTLEEEVKKVNIWKSKLDDVKKELAETQQRLSQETQRALKAEFDFRHYRELYENAKDATKRLQDDKDRLTAMLGESSHPGRPGEDLANMPSGSSVDSIELLPPIIKQKLLRLELENEKLKEDLKAAVDANPSDEGARVLVEQLRKHEAELEENFLKKEQQMLEMQNSYEEKLRRLQAQITARDEELRKKEIQYNKCMEKAKSVIVTLEPTAAAGLEGSKSDVELEKARAVREMEERLLASAFYNYGLTMHRNTVETRNSTLLQRQRLHATNRRKNDI
jgi:protein HOOK3